MSYDAAVINYKSKVTSRLEKLGAGIFVLVIDDKASRHMISDYTIDKVILLALSKSGAFVH
jgi:hypothetical protein